MSTYEYSDEIDLRVFNVPNTRNDLELGHFFKGHLARAGVKVGAPLKHHVLKQSISEPSYPENDRLHVAFSIITKRISEISDTIYNLKLKFYNHFSDGYFEVEFDTMEFHKLPE